MTILGMLKGVLGKRQSGFKAISNGFVTGGLMDILRVLWGVTEDSQKG